MVDVNPLFLRFHLQDLDRAAAGCPSSLAPRPLLAARLGEAVRRLLAGIKVLREA